LSYQLVAPEIEEHLQVSMVWTLEQGELALNPIFDTRSPNAGLYDFKVHFGAIKTDKRSTFLDNLGFGAIHSPPATFEGHEGHSTASTLNLYALYGPQEISGNERSIGLYFGVHDPQGNTKALEAYVTPAGASFNLQYWPPGSNEGNLLHELGFPIKIIPFEGDWYDAATIYREWALPNAEWTKPGKLIERGETPAWAYNLTTWLVSYGPDQHAGKDPRPQAAYEELKVMLDRLGLEKDTVALHYYGWLYLGYEPTDSDKSPEHCDKVSRYFAGEPDPCGFDTHFGDYFPARIGTESAVKGMQELGVRVIPYTNGHLVDTNS
jgi:hypothetical protein